MAFVVDEAIERYAEEHTTAPADFMVALAEETRRTLSAPQMLTGTIEGRFLELLVFAGGARRILELGTYSGYSALAMAAAIPAGGRIDTCELSEEHARFARRHIEASPHADRITIHVGPALEAVAGLAGPWDLVFIDADKPNYRAYYEAVLPKLAERGLVVVDNTLWSGRVVDESDDSEYTTAIRAFNDHVAADERAVAVMLTVRDGMTLIRRT